MALTNDNGRFPEECLGYLQPFDIECINYADIPKLLLLYSRCIRELYQQNDKLYEHILKLEDQVKEQAKTIKELELQACTDVGL